MKFLLSIILIIQFYFTGKPEKSGNEVKSIDKDIAQIKANLYAGKFEVRNIEYKRFLSELQEKGKIEDYKKYRIDTAEWLNSGPRNEPFVAYYFRHEEYDNYPVLCISHESAVAFCDWLTEKYNADPKRKFKKVKFRLPNENEWKLAAKGYAGDNMTYPWQGPYMQNGNGQYLANFYRVLQGDIKRDEKGDLVILSQNHILKGIHSEKREITAPVKSYWPNDLGIYNMAGNVAEMLAEKGKTIGGSYQTPAYYLAIDCPEDPYNNWEKPSPYIGFRYFMELVEK